MRVGRIRGTRHGDLDELGRALAVADDLLGQVQHDGPQRLRELARGLAAQVGDGGLV